jgi:hypothetical protein
MDVAPVTKEKGREVMADLGNTPPAGGRKTSEATIVVCKCKGTRFDVKKTTTSSVLLKCGACGAEVPVKGPVAHVRAGDEDITFGVEQHTFSPATEKETKEKKPKKAKDNGERKQLRFGVPPEVLEKVNNVLELVRLDKGRDDEALQAQDWQWRALEIIVDSYRADVSTVVVEHLDRQEKEIKKALEAAEAKSAKPLGGAKAGKIRRKVQSQIASMLDTSRNVHKPEPDPVVEQAKEVRAEEKAAKKKKKEAEAGTVPDDGMLLQVVKDAMGAYADTVKALGHDRPTYLITDRVTDAHRALDKSGGLMFKIVGDQRARSVTGAPPVVYIHIIEEDGIKAQPEIREEYELTFEIPGEDTQGACEIVEMAAETADWPLPSWADRREVLR